MEVILEPTTNAVTVIFSMLLLFQLKHWLADFVFQTDYMMRKFLPGWEFFLPLTAHAFAHAVGAALIVAIFDPSLMWWAGGLTLVLHFFMDRMKAGPKYMGRWKLLAGSEFATATDTQKRHNKFFWWSFGFDQMWHHCTNYLLIWLVVDKM